jgi:uncharacterized membrane-anchored protein
MNLRLVRVPSLTQQICKEVTLFFQIVMIISTALNIQCATGISVNASLGIILSQDIANNVQVRK